MEDIIQPETSEILELTQDTANDTSTAVTIQSNNLLQNHQRLSLVSQIFNWQYTGVIVRLNLPISNEDNTPVFGLKVTPSWLPAGFYMRDPTGTRRIGRYLENKPWVIPCASSTTTTSIGTTISVIETDSPPDIALLNRCCLGWSGGINYQLRCISNVTTQGKLVFSRQYDINKPAYNYNPTLYRTYMPSLEPSQQVRRKNAFMVGDLSRCNDFELQCPWRSRYSYISNVDTDMAAYTGDSVDHSYIWVDVAGLLSASAGASSCTFEVWIQAAPDFQFIYPMMYPSAFSNRETFSLNTIVQWKYGADTNVTYTNIDNMVYT